VGVSLITISCSGFLSAVSGVSAAVVYPLFLSLSFLVEADRQESH
jgi:hypothetical protein